MLLEDLQLVMKIAEFRSISQAAASLDMRNAAASAALKRVEKSLGVELFIRTTRNLRLSSAGERYLPHCQQALATLELAKQNLKDDVDIVEGELRFSVSSDLGRNLAIPWLEEVMENHPKISLRAMISDHNVDFYRDGIDVALRYGSPSNSNQYGFKICNIPRILCATTDYLEKNGYPKHPHDLASHQGLFYQLQDRVYDVWEFKNQSNTFKVKMSGKRACDDGEVVRRWCVAGKGLALKSCLDIADDLLCDNVVAVMPEYLPAMSELWLICPSRQSITPTVRLLRDTFRVKSSHILKQLITKGILDKQVLE